MFECFRVEAAHKTSYKVQEGDILLMGTDGLFDNMHEDMIVDYISKYKVALASDYLVNREIETKI